MHNQLTGTGRVGRYERQVNTLIDHYRTVMRAVDPALDLPGFMSGLKVWRRSRCGRGAQADVCGGAGRTRRCPASWDATGSSRA
jgi:hypothetical protein